MVGIKSYLCAFGSSPKDEMWYLMNTRTWKTRLTGTKGCSWSISSYPFVPSLYAVKSFLVTDMTPAKTCHLFLTPGSIQMLVSIQNNEWINLCVNKGILQLDVMKLNEMRQKENSCHDDDGSSSLISFSLFCSRGFLLLHDCQQLSFVSVSGISSKHRLLFPSHAVCSGISDKKDAPFVRKTDLVVVFFFV